MVRNEQRRGRFIVQNHRFHRGFFAFEDVRRVAHDKVIRTVFRHLAKDIAAEETNLRMVAPGILSRHVQCFLRDITSRNCPIRMPLLERNGDTSGARADIENTFDLGPWTFDRLNDFRRLGAGNECSRRDTQVETHPKGMLEHILHRFALEQTFHCRICLCNSALLLNPSGEFLRLSGRIDRPESRHYVLRVCHSACKVTNIF